MKLAYFLFFLLLVFAVVKEGYEQKNAYLQGVHKGGETIMKLRRKIEHCIATDIKTIKWRRSYITAIIATFLLFSFVYVRYPTYKELFLTIIVIYATYYISWHTYSENITSPAYENGKKNLRTLIREMYKVVPQFKT